METFSLADFQKNVAKIDFVQDNESSSSYGVIRGLHFQKPPYEQAKLVRCIQGRVLDVAVDLRTNSPTFGQHISIELSAENKRQLFLPRGIAHGFTVLSPSATFVYKVDNYYHPEAEGGINPFDKDLGIDWPIDEKHRILSDKDTCHPDFKELISAL